MAVEALAAPRGVDLPAILKEAGIAAAVAFAIALPLVGFETVAKGGGLGINTRFDWVAIGVGAVFLGRLAMGFYRVTKVERPARPSTFAKLGPAIQPGHSSTSVTRPPRTPSPNRMCLARSGCRRAIFRQD